MSVFDITVNHILEKTHSATDFISMISEVEGILQTATALTTSDVPDSFNEDGWPERDFHAICLAETFGEAIERQLIPARLLCYVEDVLKQGTRYDAECGSNAWDYGFRLGATRVREEFFEDEF
ncbi:hypothetical protein [Raoultella terrigena]|uniref:hypothetical protein n=1 Tax=Raoultella terrigena TaxID=577 RepID=UPI001F51F16E|nr:hypothetical protein [Raoultella terrigena]MCI1034841.1 hypothetical protein [Raoultella terrigena]